MANILAKGCTIRFPAGEQEVGFGLIFVSSYYNSQDVFACVCMCVFVCVLTPDPMTRSGPNLDHV